MNKKTVYSATAQMLKRMVIDVMFRCIFVRIVVGNSKVVYVWIICLSGISILLQIEQFQTYPFFINAQNEPYDVG
ncbi:hypothetical protein [Prevotella nigrescens]|uniref:hypothetical protein n=1 Tax=Prevotella nigrescens TaxID=28133 RepID=UPI0028D1342E|nr:hypothetical protein [Prevotella nigrescens]